MFSNRNHVSLNNLHLAMLRSKPAFQMVGQISDLALILSNIPPLKFIFFRNSTYCPHQWQIKRQTTEARRYKIFPVFESMKERDAFLSSCSQNRLYVLDEPNQHTAGYYPQEKLIDRQ